jgi:hypothetical protein
MLQFTMLQCVTMLQFEINNLNSKSQHHNKIKEDFLFRLLLIVLIYMIFS